MKANVLLLIFLLFLLLSRALAHTLPTHTQTRTTSQQKSVSIYALFLYILLTYSLPQLHAHTQPHRAALFLNCPEPEGRLKDTHTTLLRLRFCCLIAS